MKEVNNWIGKNIFVSLKDGSKYQGHVYDVRDLGDNLILFEVLLTTGRVVVFFLSEMIKIEEVK